MTTKTNFKRPMPLLYMNVRLKNIKDDTHLQQELEQIHRKYRLKLKLLHQDREFLLKEHRKLLHLRVCEPYATVTNTMQAISETRMTNDLQSVRYIRTAPVSRRMLSAESLSNQGTRFSVSALSVSPQRSASFRSKASDPSQLSIMQLKDMALIDIISQKQLESQQEEQRREREHRKKLYREKVQQKMQNLFRTLETV